MVHQIIKNYILEHKSKYTKESIYQALLDAGYGKSDIEAVYYEIDHKQFNRKHKIKTQTNSNSQNLIVITLLAISLFFLYLGLSH